MRLKSFPIFFVTEKFSEYLEKRITVILLSQFIDKWKDIKDEQEINDKKLDLAFISDSDMIFVEISRITLSHYTNQPVEKGSPKAHQYLKSYSFMRIE